MEANGDKMGNFVQNLESSLRTGFIDRNVSKATTYKPSLLTNNSKENESVLHTLLEELERCQAFIFSVAFITESGLATLKSQLLDLKHKGVRGRILTSTFLQFNQPKVFRELLKISNVEVRVTDLKGFHSKGYIFTHDTHYSLIVGSSNLTAHALKVNYEWNIKLTSHENGEIVHHFNKQFEDVWQESILLTEEWIEEYEAIYAENSEKKAVEQIIEWPASYKPNAIEEALKILPNKMQVAALEEIQQLRNEGKKKGLVISATGTGKTYLSAFDVRRFQPERMLFIVHREQILQKAKDDFQRVLGGRDEEFGILSGSSNHKEAKYVFATIQTLTKDQHLSAFKAEEFDYILIDEVHKAGAKSYQKVMDYFQPEFLMGMTATPERTDDFNIFELFDYNVAYEIRLQEALEEDMLCPFHYFGVTDITHNGALVEDTSLLQHLVVDERVHHIIEKMNYYGHSGQAVKGLIFCSRKDEAKALSTQFNQNGLRTVALTGEDSQEDRMRAVTMLEEGLLDYILTVEIFNEGIDIPCINQVVMLRQTQSSIIFIQQLGRGLRKHEEKEFVTIIDFIGNYKNNYLIPMALSGDKSLNKDRIRRHTKDTSYIKGVSTINFEEVAKKQVFNSIASSQLTALKLLKESYKEVKNRIGRVPLLYDFMVHDSIDPVVLVSQQHHQNYHQFLTKIKENEYDISNEENAVLTMLSTEVLNGKREHEIILLDLLLKNDDITYKEYLEQLIAHDCNVNEAVLKSVERVLDLSFFTQVFRKKYGDQPIVTFKNPSAISFTPFVMRSLKENAYFRDLVVDVLNVAKERTKNYRNDVELTPYEKYTRKDACKLLNWVNDESATVYGYKTKHQTCPIFVTYHKNEEIDARTNYVDEFISPELLSWSTRSNRTLQSEEVKSILYAKENNVDIHVFVKKDDDEGRDFYYLGKANPDREHAKQAVMHNDDGEDLPVVHIPLVMEIPVEYKLYRYIQEGKD